MFLQGILSLFQIIFLPGFLLLRLFKLKLNFFISIIFSFALSLIANYVSIFTLTALGLYTRTFVYSAFFIEVAIFLYLFLESIKKSFYLNLFTQISVGIKDLYKNLVTILNTKYSKYFYFYWVIIVSAVFSIFWAASFLGGNVFYLTVFKRLDPVVLWSKWAFDWFSGIFPFHTFHYQQLIPANWSLAYMFVGAELQYFAKMIMPLFTTYLLILMFNLGIYKKSLGYFAAVIATMLLIRHAFGGMVESGLVDLPVAFMSFLPIYCLLISKDVSSFSIVKKYLVLGIIFACGAAVTKQTALLTLVLYPLFVYLLIFRKRYTEFSFSDKWQLIIYYFIFVLVVVAPFYVYKEWQIWNRLDSSEIGTITSGLFMGSSLLQRFVYSIKVFLSHNLFSLNVIYDYYLHFIVGTILGLVYATFLIFSLCDASFRVFFFLIFIPYSLFWSMFCCYDTRNYALAVPFYGLGIGLGLDNFILFKGGHFYKRIKNFFISIKLWHFIMAVLLLLIFIHLRYGADYLLKRQEELSLEVFTPILNKKLFEYDKAFGIKKVVLTDHHFDRLVGLRNIPIKFQFFYASNEAGYCGKDSPNEFFYQQYCQNIKNPDVGYLLIPELVDKKLKNDVDQKFKDGKYELIFAVEGHLFIKVC